MEPTILALHSLPLIALHPGCDSHIIHAPLSISRGQLCANLQPSLAIITQIHEPTLTRLSNLGTNLHKATIDIQIGGLHLLQFLRPNSSEQSKRDISDELRLQRPRGRKQSAALIDCQNARWLIIQNDRFKSCRRILRRPASRQSRPKKSLNVNPLCPNRRRFPALLRELGRDRVTRHQRNKRITLTERKSLQGRAKSFYRPLTQTRSLFLSTQPFQSFSLSVFL